MTDARFPERWLNDRRFRRLSAEEFRTFSMALLWAVANRTDGELQVEDLRYIPDAVPSHASRLVEVGLWIPGNECWSIVDFSATQTSREQLDGLAAKKRQDADRQKAKRDRAKESGSASPKDVIPSRDGHVTESRDDIGQGQGQALDDEQVQAVSSVSKVPALSSSESTVCHGCGKDVGLVADHWLVCSGNAGFGSTERATGPLPADPAESCSFDGCAGVVTDHLRRKYGPVCFTHASALAS